MKYKMFGSTKLITLIFLFLTVTLGGAPSDKIGGWVDILLITESHTFVNIDLYSSYNIENVTFWIYDFETNKWSFSGVIINDTKFYSPFYSLYTPNPSYIYWSAKNAAGVVLYKGMYQHLN